MTAPDEHDLTAAELALGVLEGDERAAALRRVLSDPAFARDVERWRERLGALFADWPAAAPPPAAARRVAAIATAAGAGERRWRRIAAAAAVAAALLLAVDVGRRLGPGPAPPRRAAPAPSLVAVLTPPGGAPLAVAVDPVTRRVRTSGRVATPADRVAELWLIGADGVPRAAGLLAGAGRLALPRDLPLRPGLTAAVSIEPPGGSPKATPTGPVVATGALVAI